MEPKLRLLVVEDLQSEMCSCFVRLHALYLLAATDRQAPVCINCEVHATRLSSNDILSK